VHPLLWRFVLRRTGGKSVAEVAWLFDIGVSTYRHWEEGANEPPPPRLKHVAGVLEVGMDTLMVIPPERRYLSYYRNVAGLTLPEPAARVGMPTSTPGDIDEAATIPAISDKAATTLASVLGVSVEELRAAHQRARRRGAGTRA
jgi:hypothetical protein